MYLSDSFLDVYSKRVVEWGFPSGPNSLGEVTYRRTYARDGEHWWQTVRRVVEGVYDIMHEHCERYNLPFDMGLARYDAQQMYDLIFNFKFLPPGRGLWMMGTDYLKDRNTSVPLYNCSYVSTENIDKDFDKPFRFMADVSMLGVGVGFDSKGAGKLSWEPSNAASAVLIADSREGWVDSIGALIRWGFGVGPRPLFDYSLIRPAGSVIRGFGGVSEGPGALISLHESLTELIIAHSDEKISVRNIVDIMNLIGKCVVSGNVRRSAQIAFGDYNDEVFANLKNYTVNPERKSFGWSSNNSVYAEVGSDYSAIAERIRDNGEPGIIWMENVWTNGRMGHADSRDTKTKATNPCGEIALEHMEMCNLVETFPYHHESIEEYKQTLKYAYIYAKAVTLLPSHWAETNAVQMRNRRIGTSMSGITQFVTYRGEKEFIRWCKEGYKTIEHYDKAYSEWLCIRESIRTTTVKPSGSVSLLAGATPGVHYPTYQYYIRRIRFSENHPDVDAMRSAGYHVEQAIHEPNTVIVEFPVKGDPKVKTEKDVSLSKKVRLAAIVQQHWSDNLVSCTATFNSKTEGNIIADVLAAYETRLKGISFLPLAEEGAYDQMPYEPITEEKYIELCDGLKPIAWRDVVHDLDDMFCDGAVCELPVQP